MRSGRSVQVVLLMALVVASLVLDAAAKPTFPALPAPGRVINDAANLINGDDAAEIERLAEALLAERRYPIAVVTIRSLGAQSADGYTIERFAAELLQSWRQPETMRTYGMLLLVSAEDRKARIQLGSAWGQAHDGRARQVMSRLILPAFREGAMSKGIVAGVRGFDAMGRQEALPTDQPWWKSPAAAVDQLGLGDTLSDGLGGTLGEPWWALPALVAGGVVVLIGLVSLARRGRRSWAWVAAAFILGLVLSRILGGSAEASESGGGATGEW